MRTLMSFAFGLLVGTLVGTAYANFSTSTSAVTTGDIQIRTIEMMATAGPLPVQPTAEMN